MKQKWEQSNTRWMMAAMVAPVTQAASNCSWPVALSVGILCLGIASGMELCGTGASKSKLLSGIQWLWMLLVVSEFLHWIMLCWPNHENYHVVPLTILVLAAYTLTKGKDGAVRVAGILYWMILFLLGVVLLSGIKELKLENLKPQWRMQTAYYIVVMLLPVMGSGIGSIKQKYRVLGYAVLTAVITSGVLSMNHIEKIASPIYELSRSISLLGVGERLESLIATGMTLGYYVLITYLIKITADAWETGQTVRSVWISTAFSAMVFITGMRMNSRILALGTIVIWVLFPVLEKILKIMFLPLDKWMRK